MKKILRIIGVYDGVNTLLGELTYITKKTLGIKDCALCNVTYRGVRKNKEWLEYQKSTNTPVELIYLNQRNKKLKAFTDEQVPCIVGETKGGYIMLINKEELRAIDGNVQGFHKLLKKKLSKYNSK